MASTSTDKTADKPVNPVEAQGDHDRVAMLSLNADGTPDQHNPEIVGDKDFALEATKEQFRQQAVAAVDAAEGPVAGPELPEQKQSADIAERQKLHESAEKKAESAAEKIVNALHQG